jgi:transcriptional regulator with XRE-family HTH domain
MSEQSGISAGVLQEIENGFRNPSATILGSIARVLRLSAETLHLQAGVLDPQDADEIDVVREIRRDPHLTEHQREVLVEVYRALCAANK